jgi:hypothetical protein
MCSVSCELSANLVGTGWQRYLVAVPAPVPIEFETHEGSKETLKNFMKIT